MTTDLLKLHEEGVRAIVFYDGVCGFCNRMIRFAMLRDFRGRLRFAPLQGKTFAAIFPQNQKEETIVVVALGKIGVAQIYRRSDAVLAVLRLLPIPWRLAHLFRWVPRVLRDFAYRLVALIRYAIFGRYIMCQIPSPEQRQRFLD